jgi:hypothetical protein
MKHKNTLTLLITGFFIVSGFSQVPSYVPTSGLVGWWPFSGNANDESGNGNNGTNSGATLVSDRFGVSNKAYSFNGTSNSISIKDASNLRLQSGTISCWLRYSSSAKMQVLQKIDFNTAINQNYDIETNENIGNILIRGNYGKACSSVGGGPFCSTTGQTLNNNQWFHYVGVMDASKQYIYINGKLIGTFTMTGSMSACVGGDLLLGRGWKSFPNWYKGELDDLGIWNRALTQAEVTDLYNAVKCSNNLTISPSVNTIKTGNTATFSATTSDPSPSYIWQSDFGQGFQTLITTGNYSGTNTKTLTINNVKLSNHNVRIRSISTSGACKDTSNEAYISINDTCVNITYKTITDTIYKTITDTSYIAVKDTLIVQLKVSGTNPPNNTNTIRIYPNPASTHLIFDFNDYNKILGYNIDISNAAGKSVYNANVSQKTVTIDMSAWTGKGLYFVNIRDGAGKLLETKKIILQ